MSGIQNMSTLQTGLQVVAVEELKPGNTGFHHTGVPDDIPSIAVVSEFYSRARGWYHVVKPVD